MIPELLPTGLLPPGIHDASLDEVIERFGSTLWRRWLIEGLRKALNDLARSGCRAAYVDGSFVTAKTKPNDYDLCWDTDGVRLEDLPAEFRDLAPPRQMQRAKYRGDLLPNVIERGAGSLMLDFFRTDRESGESKGILRIDPRSVA